MESLGARQEYTLEGAPVFTGQHRHTHTHSHFGVANPPATCVFGLSEETRAPRGNPRGHRQSPGAGIELTTSRLLELCDSDTTCCATVPPCPFRWSDSSVLENKPMANITKDPLDVLNTVFVMSSMDLSREGAYATIIIILPAYIFSLVTNVLLIGIIASNRNLHEPMYILLCNLSFNDIIGISALVPRSLFDVMFEYGLMTFPACFLQAWFLHTYGAATLLILSVMAFDRYIAICHPLRYHTIMSKPTLINLIGSSWIIVFVLYVILFSLTLQYPFCRKQISTYYCDNVTILKLTCAVDTTVNNIYGLFITGFFHASGVLSIVFSYTWILITCCKTNDSESKSKAWNTCGTHLTVFVIYEISSSALVLAHRFPNTPPILQKILGLTYVVIPNCFNPVIYGLKTKDIKSKLNIFMSRYFKLNDLKLPKHEQVQTISIM